MRKETSLQRPLLRPRVAEGDVLEGDLPRQPRGGGLRPRPGGGGRGVVLEPDHPPGGAQHLAQVGHLLHRLDHAAADLLRQVDGHHHLAHRGLPAAGPPQHERDGPRVAGQEQHLAESVERRGPAAHGEGGAVRVHPGAAKAGLDLPLQPEHPQLHPRVAVDGQAAQVARAAVEGRGAVLRVRQPPLVQRGDRQRRQREGNQQQQPRAHQRQGDEGADARDQGVGGEDQGVERAAQDPLLLPQQLQPVLVVCPLMVLQPGERGGERRHLAVQREPHLLGEAVADPAPRPHPHEAQHAGPRDPGHAQHEQPGVLPDGAVHHQLEEPGEERVAEKADRLQQQPGRAPGVRTPRGPHQEAYGSPLFTHRSPPRLRGWGARRRTAPPAG